MCGSILLYARRGVPPGQKEAGDLVIRDLLDLGKQP